MKNIIKKYKALPTKYQIGVVSSIFITGLIVLPNTIVYVAGVFLSYKLIDKKIAKYITTGLFCLIALFSAVFLLPGKTPLTSSTQIKENIVATQEQQTSAGTLIDNTMPLTTTTPKSVEDKNPSGQIKSNPIQIIQPENTQSSGKFYTSSYYSSRYWYPEACDGWKGLSASYLKSYDTLEALLFAYPSKIKSPQCA